MGSAFLSEPNGTGTDVVVAPQTGLSDGRILWLCCPNPRDAIRNDGPRRSRRFNLRPPRTSSKFKSLQNIPRRSGINARGPAISAPRSQDAPLGGSSFRNPLSCSPHTAKKWTNSLPCANVLPRETRSATWAWFCARDDWRIDRRNPIRLRRLGRNYGGIIRHKKAL